MKQHIRLLTALLAVLLGFTANATAQTMSSNYLVVVNEADWCSTCKNNGPRFMKEVVPQLKMKGITMITNNLTNKDTRMQSASLLMKHDAKEAMMNQDKTGWMYVINAKHQLVNSISLASPTADLLLFIDKNTNQ